MRKGRGCGEGRDKGGLMLLNCVQEAALLTALGVRAEKERKKRHCIRSPTMNIIVHITNEKGHCKHELDVTLWKCDSNAS